MSLMSRRFSRTRWSNRSSGPSKPPSLPSIPGTWPFPDECPSSAGPASSYRFPSFRSDPDSVTHLAHLFRRHLPSPLRPFLQKLADGDPALDDLLPSLADGGEHLLHAFVHPLLALDAADPRGAAPGVHLLDRLRVGEDLVVREDVAYFRVAGVVPTDPRRVGHHRLYLFPHLFPRV